MTHCQDCGAANESSRAKCRICGRALLHPLVGDGCPACRDRLGVDAVFCRACGAPVPVDVDAEADGGAAGLGFDIDLPDWIKQTVAYTPAAPAATAFNALDALLPPGFVVVSAQPPVAGSPHATVDEASDAGHPFLLARSLASSDAPAGDGDGHPFATEVDRLFGERPEEERPTAIGPGAGRDGTEPPADAAGEGWEPPTEQPFAPLPDGGLAAMMPDWLRAGPEPEPPRSSAPAAAAAAGGAAGRNKGPGSAGGAAGGPTPDTAGSAVDPADFIGEEDLPSWIRQLVANGATDLESPKRQATGTAERDWVARPPLAPRPGLAPRAVGKSLAGDPDADTARSWPARGDLPTTTAGAAVVRSPVSDETERGAPAADVVETRSAPAAVAAGTGPLRRGTNRPVAPPPATAPTTAQTAVPAGEAPAPAVVPSGRKRERTMLPILLAVALVLLAVAALLLGTASIP